MNKQKGLALILIVFLIAVAVGGYLIYTNYSNLSRVKSRDNRNKVNLPTPTPTDSVASPVPTGDRETANWKTYTNAKYGYSIQYPPVNKISNGITEVKTQPDTSPFMYVTKDDFSAAVCSKFYAFIVIKEQPVKNIRAADYSDRIDIVSFLATKVGETINDTRDRNKPNKRLDDETVNGKSALVFESEGQNPNQKIRRLLVNTDNYVYIIGSCLTKGSIEERNLYNQILSTFKFQ